VRGVDLARERLRSQGIEGRPLARAADVVRRLVASQAQDPAGARWALGLRTAGLDEDDVQRELDEGAILRTHVLRPTWHFVAPEDVRWLLALTGPRVEAVNARRYRELALDAATLRRATGALARALEGGRALTRGELRHALARAGIGADGQRMTYLLMHAELEAVVCSGPRRGKQLTYALLDERAPRGRPRARADALAELAARYFASRGPATVHDLARWSGLLVADVRAATEAVAAGLRRDVVEGVTYWSGADARPARGRRPGAHLLSLYDEYLSSYRDRSAICDPVHARRLVGMGAALAYVVVLDGRIAGTFRRTIERRAVRVRVTPFRRLLASEREAIGSAAERFARFVGGGREVDLGFVPDGRPARRGAGRDMLSR
jgi:hypothetical protein